MQAHPLIARPNQVSSDPIADCDWNDPVSVASCARELHKRGLDAQADFEAKVLQNMEYMAGNQWLKWNPEKRYLEPDQRMPGWYRKLVFNRILPAHKMRMSKIIRYDPAWECIPVSDDQEDHLVARRQANVASYYYTEGLGIPSLLRDGLSWADISGEMYFHWFWNEEAGFDVTVKLDDLMRKPMPGQPPEAVRQMQAQDMRTFAELFGPEATQRGYAVRKSGDPVVEMIPPLDVICWPFDIISYREAQKILIVKRRTPAYVARKTGRSIEEVKGLHVVEQGDWRNSLSMSYDEGRKTTDRAKLDAGGHMIYEYIMYCPRGEDGFDKGRASITYGNDEEAFYLDDIPYDLGCPDRYCRSPLVRIQSEPIAGKYRGTCLVDQLRHAQIELNAVRTEKSNFRKYSTNSPLVRFDGDMLKDQDFTNRPGAIIKCSSQDRMPKYLERPNIGTQHDIDEQELIRHFNDISGVSSVDLGYAAGDNIQSGRAIIALQERLSENLQPYAVRIDEGIEELGVAVLGLLQQYHVDERDIQIIGEDNRVEVTSFSAAQLRPKEYGKPGTRAAIIKVRSHRNMPTSKQEVYALVNMIVQNRLFDLPPEQQSMIWRMIGYNDVRSVMDQTRIDEGKAQWEHDQWRAMKPCLPPILADNDAVHIQQHERFTKTEEYRTLTGSNPMLAEEIDNHIRTHQEQMARKQLRGQYVAVMADIKEWQAARKAMAQKAVQEGADPKALEIYYPAPLGPAAQAIAMYAQSRAVEAGSSSEQGQPSGDGGEPPPERQPPDAGPTSEMEAPQGPL